jgi:hypothetical protein
MIKPITALIVVVASFLTGCADTSVSRHDISNGPVALLSFADTAQQENLVSQQANALNDLSHFILRASKIKCMKVGAAVGCGLALVSAGNARRCVVGALAGGAAGAIAGRQTGKRQIAKRVELVNPNQLVRSIRKTNDTMETLTGSLPQLLAAQDRELDALSLKRDMGTLSQADYEKRYSEIKSSRADLAQSLTLSSKQANLAGDNLEHAASQGQTGLEWHFGAAQNIAEQAESARSSISLL